MILKNKKTGEILPLGSFIIQNPNRINCEGLINYDSLAELNEEWEDYEEPKEYWYIDTCEGWEICKTKEGFGLTDKENKEIGNYFETKEEAEKAVEKLKAWKRLKDSGFKLSLRKQDQYLYFEADWCGDCVGKMKDLNLLFGGEE